LKQERRKEAYNLSASQNETALKLKCPECGSIRVFHDGFRKAPSNAVSNEPIQRYRCADYGHRWSEHIVLNVKDADKQSSRISATPEKAKNLAPTTKLKIVAEKERHSPTENELKAAPQIEKLITQLVNDGRKPCTIRNYRKSFKLLLKNGADLFDAESTKAALAKSTVKSSTKQLIVYVLYVWFDFNAINWRAPKYCSDSEIPYIPTEAELDQLIAGLGKKTAVYCAILKDTGARPGEVSRLSWVDIDFGQRRVRIKAEKNSNSRVLPLSAKTIDMLCQLPRTKERIFGNADDMRSCYSIQRRNLAKKIANPNIALICFKTFRHWKGTTEQHKTKDPWHVKLILGHKKISSTEKYIHLEQMMYLENSDQFTVKVADTLEEAVKLMEVGFEFHATVEGHQLFRKRK
jgi:integrase